MGESILRLENAIVAFAHPLDKSIAAIAKQRKRSHADKHLSALNIAQTCKREMIRRWYENGGECCRL